MLSTLRKPQSSATFLPEDYVAAKAEHRASFLTVLLFSVVMFCIVSAFLITNRRWVAVRERQQSVNDAVQLQAAQIAQLEELQAQRAELMEKAQVTSSLIESVPRSVLLAELATALPSQITLQEVNLEGKRLKDAPADDKAGQVKSLSKGTKVKKENAKKAAERPKVSAPRFEFTLVIVGLSTTNVAVADYMTTLKASPLLTNVEIEYIQETVVDGRDLRRFSMVATLRQDVTTEEVELVRARCGMDPGSDASPRPPALAEADQEPSPEERE